MPSTTKNNARIEFRLSRERKSEIEQAALVRNLSVTDFATSVLTEAARRVLAEQAQHEHVRLSDRDRDRFLAMLDGNTRPNKALLLAARKHRKLIVR